ncbi:TldD/PmbA family protein [Candidatus Bathyarchaeota archaeon]|nr:MAG: TldD/PmbA family protein [Candidatus Bathyarchaeota archaeon]
MSLETNWNRLTDSAHKAIRALEKENITTAEAFFTNTRTTEVVIRNSEIITQNRVDDSGVGFRVVAPRNRVGFACTNSLSEKAILKAAEKAFAIAQVSSRVPNFALPETGQPTKVEGLFDPQVAEIGVEEGVDAARRMVHAAEDYDKRVIAKDGRVIFESGMRGVVNTLGVDVEEQETKAMIYLGASGVQNGEVTGSCYDAMLSRAADLEPESVGKSVGKMVVGLFKPQLVRSFQGTVIFGAEAVSYQLFNVLIDALKGENVVAGSSAWAEKLGGIEASENFTVEDNAVLEKGFSSRSFDDEGCCSQNAVLIKKGKVEGFLHNATSANALKTRNTGNASRFIGGFDMVSAIIGNGYRTKPQIHPSNLIIQPGSKTKEELVSETVKGVLVESMAGFAQPGSGMISAQLSRAFFIENGEIQHPIKGGMVSGIAFDWFKRISGISKETRKFVNAVVPSLRVEEVKVIGA